MSNRIIIIDDDELVCRTLQRVLLKFEYEVEYCLDGERAVEKVKDYEPDLILLDIYLTTVNGLDLLKEFQKQFFNTPVIMITGYSDVNIAVKAMKLGAYDFLLKPVDIDQLKLIVEKAFSNINLKAEVDKLNAIVKDDLLTKDFFGKSSKIKKILSAVEKLAKSMDTTILIDGESGTGKEMFAKFIHQNSPRANGPFIQINCSAIPRELAESELFGHEKGAFTGAIKTKIGKFELAQGGTLFLDEIGDLSNVVQTKFLRVLETRKFERVGGNKTIKLDARIITATNKNLSEEINAGRFREDLFYRINVINIHLPPLRERMDDFPLLVNHFIEKFNAKFNKSIKQFSSSAYDLIIDYNYPGNIRELENVIEHCFVLCSGEIIQVECLPKRLREQKKTLVTSSNVIQKNGFKNVERELIISVLEKNNHNRTKAANELNINPSTLWRKIKKLGIEI